MRSHELLQPSLPRDRMAAALGSRLDAGVRHGVLSAVAALLAYWPTHVLGLREGFWAAIAAIAVVQTEFQTTRSTARDQFLGAAVGGAIAVGVSIALHTQNLLVYTSVII